LRAGAAAWRSSLDRVTTLDVEDIAFSRFKTLMDSTEVEGNSWQEVKPSVA
jgi:hypothetical protein